MTLCSHRHTLSMYTEIQTQREEHLESERQRQRCTENAPRPLLEEGLDVDQHTTHVLRRVPVGQLQHLHVRHALHHRTLKPAVQPGVAHRVLVTLFCKNDNAVFTYFSYFQLGSLESNRVKQKIMTGKLKNSTILANRPTDLFDQ